MTVTIFSTALPIMALAGLIYVFSFYLSRRLRAGLQGRFNQRDSKGRAIPKTGMNAGNLPAGMGLIARVGESARNRMTFDRVYMRPTIGLRVIINGLSGWILYLMWTDQGGFIPTTGITAYLIVGAVVYGLFYINFYQAQYDQHALTIPNALLFDQTRDWKDLIMVQDDGHYAYVLTFATGPKLRMQKYLVGARTFLTFANEQMRKHNRI